MKIRIILFVLIAIAFVGCKSNQKSDEHADHHDEVKVKITAYSNEFELFAEADPFVVGKTSEILSHFSHLPEFTALEEGSMTIRLIVGGKENTQTLEEPTRKGIYKFELKPEFAGQGQIVFDIKNKKGNFQVLVSDIIVYKDEHEAIHEAEKIVYSSTNTTVFTKEQSWKIEFATGHPEIKPFGEVIKTTAKIDAAQGDEILISAKTNGIIMLSSENLLEGKSVSNGQLIYTISGSDLADNNSAVRFSEAKNNFEKAKADFERVEKLAEDKIISEKELLEAKNKYENTKSIYDNLNKNFSANGQRVSSTMNGFIKQIFVKNGQYVEAGQPIVVISQNKSLLLKAEVQQKYASSLSAISSANIRTLYSNITYTLEELNGKIVSFGKNANEDNYLIPVSLLIENKGDFIPGGFVELYLKTLSSTQALTIPNSALIEEQGIYFVFVQVHPELFEKKEVKIGVTDGIQTEILKGVTETDRIVTKGAIMIKLAQATGTLDAHSGHNH